MLTRISTSTIAMTAMAPTIAATRASPKPEPGE